MLRGNSESDIIVSNQLSQSEPVGALGDASNALSLDIVSTSLSIASAYSEQLSQLRHTFVLDVLLHQVLSGFVDLLFFQC